MSQSTESFTRRRKLLSEVERLAEVAVFGTLSETYRTCGRPGCHCQRGGPKHGGSHWWRAGKLPIVLSPLIEQPEEFFTQSRNGCQTFLAASVPSPTEHIWISSMRRGPNSRSRFDKGLGPAPTGSPQTCHKV